MRVLLRRAPEMLGEPLHHGSIGALEIGALESVRELTHGVAGFDAIQAARERWRMARMRCAMMMPTAAIAARRQIAAADHAPRANPSMSTTAVRMIAFG